MKYGDEKMFNLIYENSGFAYTFEKVKTYLIENWEFDENDLMKKYFASINDLPIEEKDRRIK